MLNLAGLGNRASHLHERMDDERAPLVYLHNTYRDFYHLNRLISQWRWIYRHELAPLFNEQAHKTFTLLDVGCGGGDIAYYLLKWSRQDGFKVHITAIDLDERAIHWATKRYEHIAFRHTSTRTLVEENRHFDVVINNHVLHHLSDAEIPVFLEECQQLGTKVICNDLERHPISYLMYSICFPLRFRKSFIYEDGRMSIQKSFTKQELQTISPTGWRVRRLFPFRLLALYHPLPIIDESSRTSTQEVSG